MLELRGKAFGLMQQAYGGDVLNSAIYLARLMGSQLTCYFVSAMGTDTLSQQLLTDWRKNGVNTSLVLRDPQRYPGLYFIQVDAHGERTFLYWRDNSAARYLVQHPDYPVIQQTLTQMDALYVSGISLAILPSIDRTTALQTLRSFAQLGKKIIFDSNYRPTLWPDRQTARTCYQALLADVDIALVTAEDEYQLWGDRSISDIFTRLQQAGVKEAVIKNGAQGCYYQNLTDMNSSMIPIAAILVDNVVDTTAAGDAFNAAFLAALLTGCSRLDAAQFGHQLASMVIQYPGAIIPYEAMQSLITTLHSPLLQKDPIC